MWLGSIDSFLFLHLFIAVYICGVGIFYDIYIFSDGEAPLVNDNTFLIFKCKKKKKSKNVEECKYSKTEANNGILLNT